jgi:hypothetical protein
VLTAVCESIQCSWTIECDSVLHIRPLAAPDDARTKARDGLEQIGATVGAELAEIAGSPDATA